MKKLLITLTSLMIGFMVFVIINDLPTKDTVIAHAEEIKPHEDNFEDQIIKYAEATQLKINMGDRMNRAEFHQYINLTDKYLDKIEEENVNDLYVKKIQKLKELLLSQRFNQVIDILTIPQAGDADFVGPIK